MIDVQEPLPVCFFFLVFDFTLVTMASMRTAIYPGSFDPFTNGHLDIVERASRLFDRVVVAVATSEAKNPLFSIDERVALVRRTIRRMKNVEVDDFDGLLVDYVTKRSAQAVVRPSTIAHPTVDIAWVGTRTTR